MNCFKPWKKHTSSHMQNDIFKNIITHTLDFSKVDIILCDTDFNIIYTNKFSNTDVTNNKIKKNINDIQPKELGIFYNKLHKDCQERKIVLKRNILINNDLFYITVMPLFYYKVLIGSSLKIIAYLK